MNNGRSKKRKKAIAKGKLSFGADDDELVDENPAEAVPLRVTGHSNSPSRVQKAQCDDSDSADRRRFGPNAKLGVAPKALTKSALLRESETKEKLRKEFLIIQEAVKVTDIVIPFVFFDGTNVPGGACKVKKGEHVWLFLDKSRKVGAELGISSSSSEKGSSRREWARVGVDDLMLVRGEIIIPHHYDFYYFIVNNSHGPKGRPLFDYQKSMELSKATSALEEREAEHNPLSVPGKAAYKDSGQLTPADDLLEGAKDDPTFTKVVDRRWYERNKHIFPASTWEEFDPGKNYTNAIRKDAQGNSFFF